MALPEERALYSKMFCSNPFIEGARRLLEKQALGLGSYDRKQRSQWHLDQEHLALDNMICGHMQLEAEGLP